MRNARLCHFVTRSLRVWGAAALLAACGPDVTGPDEGGPASGEGCGSFEEFKARYVYVDPQGVAIVNGDTPVASEEDLRGFYSVACGKTDDALVVNRVNGVDDRWDPAQVMNLTYCVGKTFSPAQRAAVITAMNRATVDWEASARVNFAHVTALDGNCNAATAGVVFDVNLVNSGGEFLARAFFPSSPRSQRNILIDPTAFDNIAPWTLTGVLRHELGHALGFRHEHIRPEAGVCFEDNAWRPLTGYDSASVMHYPQCNGSQTGDLALTATDRQGAASLYGPAPTSGTWTPWLNRDGPSGVGDWETLGDFINAGQVCSNPLAIQCQTLAGVDWTNAGEVYSCEVRINGSTWGGICQNTEQPDGSCQNYRARFLCP
ncbi:MAG TPA: M57 family metalloprotease [Polyangiaceae bacterium]|nr:M57 family metalloprotease [Polyangiaceae bacterium]